MQEIAKNEYYELAYDSARNWIHWTMRGFWPSMNDVPDFASDWAKAVEATKAGWKIYANLSELKVMPDDVKNAQDEQQRVLMEKGCQRVCCLIDSAVTKLSLNTVLKNSGMSSIVQYFTADEAEDGKTWLAA